MSLRKPRRERTSLVLIGITLGAVAASAEPRAQEGEAPAGTPPPSATVAWKYAPAGSGLEDLVADGKTVFVLDRKGRIHAVDAKTGDARWISKVAMSCNRSFGIELSPVKDFGAVLVGCDTGVFALRVDTGEPLWHTEVAGGIATPACTARAVIAGGSDGKIHAFDLKTGASLWEADCMTDRPDDPPGFAGARARFDGFDARPGAAATDERIVVVPFFDQCRVVAVDATSGKRRWDFRTQGWTHGRPAFGLHNVFVPSQDCHVYAVDKEMGKEAWRVATKSRNEAPTAAVDRFVYFGSCDGNLHSADEVVGRVQWRFPIEPDERGGTPIYGCPVVIGDTVHLAAMTGVLYAVDRRNGKLQWKLRPSANSELNGDLVSIGARLFLTTRRRPDAGESALFAIDPP
jgi:outer membrane protein assembly factor BamB